MISGDLLDLIDEHVLLCDTVIGGMSGFCETIQTRLNGLSGDFEVKRWILLASS